MNITADNIIVLFPIKLETRFIHESKDTKSNKLRIRVYPDQIAIDSHIKELSETEKIAKNTFDEQEDKLAAWRTLCRSFGSERAAWIVKSEGYEPPNNNWKTSTYIMPKFFTFYLTLKIGSEQKNLTFIGKEIPDILNLDLLTENSWITNFDEAEINGMAIEVNLEKEWNKWAETTSSDKEVEKIVVVGIREDYYRSREKLEKLFENHHYSKGMSFVAPGTPTNNTTEVTSGYSSKSNPNESYEVELQDSLFQETTDKYKQADGQILATALNINPSIFYHIKGSGDFTRRNAKVINTALWQASLGPYLEELFNSNEGEITHLISKPDEENFLQAMDWFRFFMIDNVMGRGVFPSLRIGKQPYGFMPISIIDNDVWEHPSISTQLGDSWVMGILDTPEKGFEKNFTNLLKKIKKDWIIKFNPKLKNVLQDEGSPDFHKSFMNILGLQPYSVAFYNRFLVEEQNYGVFTNNAQRITKNNLKTLLEETEITSYINWNQEKTILMENLTRLKDINLLNGNFVSNNIGENTPLAKDIEVVNYIPNKGGGTSITINQKNYIEYLTQVDIPVIIEEMQQGEEKSNSILFLLLRKALLNQYWDAAMRVFEKIELRDFSIKGLFEYENIRNELNESSWPNQVDYIEEKLNNGLGWSEVVAKNKSLNEIKQEEIEEGFGDGGKLYHYLLYFLRKKIINENGVEVSFDEDEILTLDLLEKYWTEKRLSRSLYKNFVVSVKETTLWKNFINGQNDGYYYENLIRGISKIPFLFIEGKKGEFPGTNPDAPPSPIWKYLNLLGDTHSPKETYQLREFRKSVDIIQNLPTAELERLLAEHIDLCTYRLDAWWLGLIHKRFIEIRTQKPDNMLYIGAYGYVEHLRPKDTISDKQGFIHTPSIGQATTSAILRSGFETTGDNSAAAVNLSSNRIQKALYYLDGMRNGRALGELLGYQYERRLHEFEIDKYIFKFRETYSFQPFQSFHSETAHNIAPLSKSELYILDGEKLLSDSNAEDFIENITSGNVNHKDLLIEARNEILNDMDAVGDVLLAEGVHQVSMGNYERANAAMSVLNHGGVPPELDFIKTSRRGNGLTHKVCIQWKYIDNKTTPTGWPSLLTPRSLAEPSFNHWLAKIIGNPSKIGCIVRPKNQDTDSKYDISISLLDLNLQPIDIFYLFQEANKTEITKRIYKAAASKSRRLASQSLSVSHKILYNLSTIESGRSIEQIEIVLDGLFKLIAGSRQLESNDFVLPNQYESPTIERTDNPMLERTVEIQNNLKALLDALSEHINNLNTVSSYNDVILQSEDALRLLTDAITKLRQILKYSSYYGLLDLIEENDLDIRTSKGTAKLVNTAKELISTAKKTRAILKDRLNKSKSYLPTQEKAIYLKSIRHILGSNFKIYCSYILPDPPEIVSAWLRSSDSSGHNFLPNRSLIMEEWLTGIGRVRDKMGILEQTILLDEINQITTNSELTLRPIQLPFFKDDHWVGMELPENYYKNIPEGIEKNKLSMVFLGSTLHAFPNKPFAGILIDEWNEAIPEPEITTGLSFNYNQPSNEAPQTVLIAVTPTGGETFRDSSYSETNWNSEKLKNTVLSAINLAKLRAVEPDYILADEFYSKFLPAITGRIVSNDSDTEVDFSTDFGINIDNSLNFNDE